MVKANNAVHLIGRIAQDAQQKTAGEKTVAEFSLAVATRRDDNNASFFDCALYGAYADSLSPHLTKGKQIALAGNLRQERWKTQDGEPRSRVRIVVDSIELLSAAPEEATTET